MATGATSKEFQLGARTPGWRTRMVRHYHEQHPKLRAAALSRVIRQLHGVDAPQQPFVASTLLKLRSTSAKKATKLRAKSKTRKSPQRVPDMAKLAQALERPSGTEAAPRQTQIKRSRLSHDKVREKAAAEHHRSLMKLKRLAHEVGGLPRVHKLLAELTELSS